MKGYGTDTARKRPYVWVTWLTKLLADETKCVWAAWYRAHFKYEKTQDATCEACRTKSGPCTDPRECRASFFASYNAKHDAITARRAAELKAQGYVVRLEDDNDFKIEGKGGILAGKPDLTALRGEEPVLVSDSKSGRRRDSDMWQVLIYAFALPLAWLQGHKIRGEVAYHDGNRSVPPITDSQRKKIAELLRTVTGAEEPEASPSTNECSRCDIAHCPVRAEEVGDATGYF